MKIIIDDFDIKKNFKSNIQQKYFMSSLKLELEKQLKGVKFWNSNQDIAVSYLPEKLALDKISDVFSEMTGVPTPRLLFGCWAYVVNGEVRLIFDPIARVGFRVDNELVTLFSGGHFRLSFSNLSALLAILNGGFPLHSCAFTSTDLIVCFSGDGGIGKTKTALAVTKILNMSVLNDDLNLLFNDIMIAYDRPAAVYQSHLDLLNRKRKKRIFKHNVFWRIINKISKSLGWRPPIYFEYDLVPSRVIFPKIVQQANLAEKRAVLAYCKPILGDSISRNASSNLNPIDNIINSSLNEFNANYSLLLSVIVLKYGTLEKGLEKFRKMLEANFNEVIEVEVGKMTKLETLAQFWKDI